MALRPPAYRRYRRFVLFLLTLISLLYIRWPSWGLVVVLWPVVLFDYWADPFRKPRRRRTPVSKSVFYGTILGGLVAAHLRNAIVPVILGTTQPTLHFADDPPGAAMSVLIGMPFGALAGWIGGAVYAWYATRPRYPAGLCQTCGYIITGAPHECCPECGSGIPRAAPIARTVDQVRSNGP